MSKGWMPLYVADYLADTGHFTTIEHGAYCLLIMNYWSQGGLPEADEDLARITRLPLREWMKIRPRLHALFRPGWTHKRIEAELALAADKHERRAAAGKIGGYERAKRYPRGLQQDSNAIAMPVSVSSNAMAGLCQSQSHSPSQNSHYSAGVVHCPNQDRAPPSPPRTRGAASHGRNGGGV